MSGVGALAECSVAVQNRLALERGNDLCWNVGMTCVGTHAISCVGAPEIS